MIPLPWKLAIGAGVIIAAVIGGWLWLQDLKADAYAAGRADCVAEAKAATDAEAERRRLALEASQETGRALAAALSEKERQHASLAARLAQLSRANDNRTCHDAAAVDRINSVR